MKKRSKLDLNKKNDTPKKSKLDLSKNNDTQKRSKLDLNKKNDTKKRAKHDVKKKKNTKKKLKRDVTTIIFIVLCLIAVVFILSPLLIRIPCVHDAVSLFLCTFSSPDYKGIYIETVGATLGTFLAITSVFWTQSISNKHEENIQIKKNALTIYYDLKFAIEDIAKIMNAFFPAFYPKPISNTLPNDKRLIDLFHIYTNKQRIYLDSNWRQLIISMYGKLTDEEIRELQIFYSKLSILSTYLNLNTSEKSYEKDKEAYSSMFYSIVFSINLSTGKISILIEKNISSIINKLAEIANIENKKIENIENEDDM